MIPSKIEEAVGLKLEAELAKIEGSKFSIQMKIVYHKMGKLIQAGMQKTEEEGEKFEELLETILTSLKTMEMPDKVKEVEDKIGTNIRNAIMGKLQEMIPTQLATEDVKCECVVPEYAPVEEEPLNTDMPALREPFTVTLSDIDRKAILDDAVGKKPGHRLIKAIGKKIPEKKFNEKIAQKLSGEIPAALKEKVGLVCECVRKTEQEEKGEICIQTTVVKYDLVTLIKAGKGEAFAEAFMNLLNSLSTFVTDFGMAQMQEKIDFILGTIESQVRANVGKQLQDNFAEKLHCKTKLTL